MNFASKSVFVLSVLMAATTAMAQAKAPEPDYTLAYNVGAVSDYRFRGIAQTSKKPAIQGGVDFAAKSGVYLGAWASNVDWVKNFNGATKGSYELDLYGGYKGEIAPGLGFDVGAITYQYPGNNSGVANAGLGLSAGANVNANTNEFYGALTHGIFTAKYSRSAGDFLGIKNSSGSSYIDLAANIDLSNGITLTPHVGHQKVANHSTGTSTADYTDYALTIAKDMGNGLVINATATGTNSKSGTNRFYMEGTRFIANNAFLVGAKYSF